MMNFGQAVMHAMDGRRVARFGWNGKGMWLQYVPATGWTLSIEGVGNLRTAPFMVMKNASGQLIPWLASQEDILAVDWTIVLQE
jgi:hypothetical protein